MAALGPGLMMPHALWLYASQTLKGLSNTDRGAPWITLAFHKP